METTPPPPSKPPEVVLPPKETLNDLTLQAQAFEINSSIFKETHPLPDIEKARKDGGAISSLVAKIKAMRISDKLAHLDHASRYFNGQPHDKDYALSGIGVAIDMAVDRTGAIKQNPDDATAAFKDLPYLDTAYDRLRDKLYPNPQSK